MSDLKTVMQSEIRRLAKKEAKTLMAPYEKKIKELIAIVRVNKKEVASLRKAMGKVNSGAPAKSKLTVSKEELDKSRLSAKMILKLRSKLGLSRDEFAKLVGASAHAIYLWESGRAKPRKEFRAKIIAIRSLGKRDIQEQLGQSVEDGAAAPQEKTTKKVAKKATKKAVKKTAKKATKKAVKKTAKKATKKVAKKTAEKAVKKTAKKASKKVVKKAKAGKRKVTKKTAAPSAPVSDQKDESASNQ